MRSAAVFLLLLAVAPAARADDEIVWDEEEPPPIYVPKLRSAPRPMIGFDFGLGAFDGLCRGCYSAGGVSLDVFAGAQLSPRVALLVDAWGVIHILPTDGQDSGLATHGIGALAARIWILPTLWIQAGAGAGLLGAYGRIGKTSTLGPAAMLAIGGELAHRPRHGIDIQLRSGGTLLRDADDRTVFYSVAAVVGYHWN